LIDLHTHTTESDGTYTPAQLIDAARARGLEALAITDHDTFAGFDQALPMADDAGIELICGIELSTKLAMPDRPRGKSVHLLAYFMRGKPTEEFRQWLFGLQQSRRERNERLAEKLQSLGVHILLEEVNALGKSMAGRPHFAQIMVKKGYVETQQEAFDRYLDDSAEAFVDRREPTLAEAIRHVLDSGGVPTLAHPVRLGKRMPQDEEELIRQMCKLGLRGIEVWHSDHTARDRERFDWLARRYNLTMTGGSDFHGDNKPGVELGSGRRGNVRVGLRVLERLRGSAETRRRGGYPPSSSG
jgi:predicted metal-dependent phosphoesterase TrpH